jgi:SRSO17 transposase
MQHLLGRAKWDAEAVRDDLQSYVRSHLAEPGALLVIDETSFLKKGTHSVGVGPQYSGITGHLENCQVGVFLVYATAQGATFYDRALYLPKDWAADVERRRQADVPAEVRFATKPQLAQRMVERALDGGLPVRWVVGDEVYGNDGRLRRALEERRQRYALTISATTDLWLGWTQQPARQISAAQPPEAWARLSAGEGAKGPRIYDWTRVRVNNASSPAWERWLVARRSVTRPDDPRSTAYFLVFAPAATTLEEIVRALGQRWTSETGFEESKGEVGLDQYEVRSWQGWHRHITLAMLAHAFLTVLRVQTHAQDTPLYIRGRERIA